MGEIFDGMMMDYAPELFTCTEIFSSPGLVRGTATATLESLEVRSLRSSFYVRYGDGLGQRRCSSQSIVSLAGYKVVYSVVGIRQHKTEDM